MFAPAKLFDEKRWRNIDDFDLNVVLSKADRTEIESIMSRPGSEVNIAGRARTPDQHFKDCIVGKCAEYDFRTKHNLHFISPRLEKQLMSHPKYETMKKNGFKYNDLIDLKTGFIFEIKCWGEQNVRRYNDPRGGWNRLFEAKRDGWLVADFFVIYAKNYPVSKIRIDGVYKS